MLMLMLPYHTTQSGQFIQHTFLSPPLFQSFIPKYFLIHFHTNHIGEQLVMKSSSIPLVFHLANN